MIFTLFATIVFISEIIIFISVIIFLLKIDQKIINTDKFITEAKPKIASICILIKDISEQMTELVPIWIENTKKLRDKFILSRVESLISSVLFWGLNIKIINKIKKSKFLMAFIKGLSFIQNMI